MLSRFATSSPTLHGRHIVLGISGGVAAYKAVYLARRLLETGAVVQAVMTSGALRFVGEQSLAAITGRPVVTSLFGAGKVSPHTDLARWADAIVIAPATANIIAKVAHGISDDALAAVILAFEGPVILAPAMHTEMWNQSSTQRNVATLQADGRTLVGPTEGALAGGDQGAGRMVEPEQILESVASVFDASLTGRQVVITAGGTREPIDPVRYIGNRSSGKMGHALATAASLRGAQVTLITTSDLEAPPIVKVVRVDTAEQMAKAAWDLAPLLDVAILAAAVADFRPSDSAAQKLHRSEGPPALTLEETPNVLRGLVERSPEGAVVVGFAAETGSLDRATTKARSYGVDLLVANDVSEAGNGFGSDTNKVRLITPDGHADDLESMPKLDVADAILDRVVDLLKKTT